MIVGVPKEIKDNEYRVALTPAGVREFVAHGHQVLVESGAGTGSSLPDAEYGAVGAEIVDGPAPVFERAELVLKVKEPQPVEIERLRPDQILFTFLHLAADAELTRGLVASGAVCVAYETVELSDGSLPLLAPMSEVAGRMAAQVGATYLQRPMGGRGVLMGGVAGVPAAQVVVIGAGTAGSHAASVALGMGARVVLMDIDIDLLRHIEDQWSAVRTLYSNIHNIEQAVLESDLVVGAVLRHGAKAPWLVSRELVGRMKPGSVIVDISIDQGGCVETIHPTTHSDPVYVESDVVHYAVTNMPGAVPHTSTFALTNATLRYGIALADKGWRQAVSDDPALAKGANVVCGALTCEPVAEAHALEYTSLADAI